MIFRGPTGVIAGVICDEQNRPVDRANILLKDKKDIVTWAVSSDGGKFVMLKVRTGIYSLEMNIIGYEDREMLNVEVVEDSVSFVKMMTHHDAGWIYNKGLVWKRSLFSIEEFTQHGMIFQMECGQ